MANLKAGIREFTIRGERDAGCGMVIISGTRESAIFRSGIREIIISNEPRYLGVKLLKGEYKMAPFFLSRSL